MFTLLIMIVSVGMMSAQTVKQLNSPEVNQLLKKTPKIVVLDVRTPEEFAQGHLKGAKNIDIRQPDFYSRVDKLDKNQTYLVYCRTNHRSGVAVEYMSQHGFQKLYQMMDGFPGWAGNNLLYEK
jgi:rhodanese-related sulfurtransferase